MHRIQTSLRCLALLLSVLTGLVGCVSLDQAAPPVALLGTTTGGDGRSAVLEQGRVIYITKCAKCHAVEPVTRYSRVRWKEIMSDMADEAKLSATENDAVRAYVVAVLDHAARP